MPAENQMPRPQRATSAETARILGRRARSAVGVQGGDEDLQPPQAGNGEEERWCSNGADLILLYNPL